MRTGPVIAATIIAFVLFGSDLDAESAHRDPASLVQEFYDRYPDALEGGLPRGAELDWLGMYLSERLVGLFRSALDYQFDWIRRHPDDPPYYNKPPFADGVDFTGTPDAIVAFKVREAERLGPGLWQVPVHFWYDLDRDGWEAMVMVIDERSRYAIDDFVFCDFEPDRPSWRLSESLEWREDE